MSRLLTIFTLSIKHSVVVYEISDGKTQNWVPHTFLPRPPWGSTCHASSVATAMPPSLTSLLLLWNLFSPHTGETLPSFLPASSLSEFILKSFLPSPLLHHLEEVLRVSMSVSKRDYDVGGKSPLEPFVPIVTRAFWCSQLLSASPTEGRNAAISVSVSNTVTHLSMPRATLKMKLFIDSNKLGFYVYRRTL